MNEMEVASSTMLQNWRHKHLCLILSWGCDSDMGACCTQYPGDGFIPHNAPAPDKGSTAMVWNLPSTARPVSCGSHRHAAPRAISPALHVPAVHSLRLHLAVTVAWPLGWRHEQVI